VVSIHTFSPIQLTGKHILKRFSF